MKNMKKLLQKAMVFTLTAAMLVGTPMTASAAGLVDLFSISDGSGNTSGDKTTPTQTVTNTDTNSNSTVLSSNDAKIMGIVLDQSNVTAEVEGETKTLKATIILDGVEDEDLKAEILEKLNSKIKWEVLNKEGDKYRETPSTVLAIDASAADRTVVKLNPKKGSRPGQEMIVRASIDGRYYYDAEGDKVEIATGVANAYTAEATVFVKEYSKSLEFEDVPPTVYVKHTLDMNECLVRTPGRANDTITWTSDNASIAPVTAAGVVTFKKVDPTKKVTIRAVSEQGATAKYTFGQGGDSVIDAGTPASKVEIWYGDPAEKVTKLDADLAFSGEASQVQRTVVAKMWAKVNALVDESNVVITDATKIQPGSNGKYKAKSVELAPGASYFEVSKDKKSVYGLDASNNKVSTGITAPLSLTITDDVDWSSNKDAIASVAGHGIEGTIKAETVGKANITAKASSGKKATLSYTVKATLKNLEIKKNVEELYTGQTFQLEAIKDPSQNKDAVSFFLSDETGKVKKTSKSVSVNGKGVVTVKQQINGGKNEEVIYVGLKTNGKVVKCVDNKLTDTKDYVYAAEPIKITLKQSSIKDITVKDDANKPIASIKLRVDGKAVGRANEGIAKADNTTKISVPKGRTYTAQVTPSGGYEGCGANTLAWKSSSTKVAEIVDVTDSGIVIKAKAKGTSTVTVSGITMINGKAKVMKTTFKVEVKQPVNTVTMNKPTVILARKLKSGKTASQKVSLKVTLGPKGVNSKEAVKWEIEKYTTDSKGNLIDANIVEDDERVPNDGTRAPKDSRGNLITKTSVSFELKAPEIGDVYKVTAQAGTASATSYIYILDQTKSVKIAKEVTKETDGLKVTEFKNGNKIDACQMTIGGDSIKMIPVINLGTPRVPNYHEMAEVTVDENNKVTGAVEKNVTYTVNKKGIVTIDDQGNVYAVKKGKVTITAKTPSGKSGKLTIDVVEPTAN